MAVQVVARWLAQDLVQRRPARLLVEWIVEQLLDPRCVEVLGGAVPVATNRPHGVAPAACSTRLGRGGDLRALRATSRSLQLDVVGACGRSGQLGHPPEGRTA